MKKHLVDKECGMMNVNCQKLLNAFFFELPQTNSHIRTNNTAKYSFLFFWFFFDFFLLKCTGEKKTKNWKFIHLSKFEIEAIFRTIDEETLWHWCNIHNAPSFFICNVHQILYNNALTKGKKHLAVQRKPQMQLEA